MVGRLTGTGRLMGADFAAAVGLLPVALALYFRWYQIRKPVIGKLAANRLAKKATSLPKRPKFCPVCKSRFECLILSAVL